MHRSGTSALAGLLSNLGFNLPNDPMPPREDNPAGFHESLAIVRLNNDILESLGSAWDQVGPWYAPGKTPRASAAILTEWLRRRWGSRAVQAIEQAYPRSSPIVLKDPRISLLLPLWQAAVEATGRKPAYVIALRNPLAVAASLQARNGTPARLAFWLWQSYMLGAMRSAREAVLVHYDQVLEEPEAAIDAIIASLSLRCGPAERQAVLAAIIPSLRHHALSPDAVEEAMLLPRQVAELWALLRSWNSTREEVREANLADLQARYEDAALLAFQGRVVPALDNLREGSSAAPPMTAAASAPALPAPIKVGVAARPLLLHYHLFKNAGSSVDQMLSRNFPTSWAEREFTMPGRKSNVSEVTKFLNAHPELDALSSHTALLPLPEPEGRSVFPILFLRHPILRLRSAYLFERKQIADTEGARLAKRTDFPGYITALLEHETSRQAKNFQVFRLSFGTSQYSTELERARHMLDKLPFVGLVEAYDDSICRLEALIKPQFPNFKAIIVRVNVTDAEPAKTIGAQVERVRAELGDALFERLVDANAEDIALHAELAARQGVSLE
jgi:hypothetical protein